MRRNRTGHVLLMPLLNCYRILLCEIAIVLLFEIVVSILVRTRLSSRNCYAQNFSTRVVEFACKNIYVQKIML
jgi:hypothetical protein